MTSSGSGSWLSPLNNERKSTGAPGVMKGRIDPGRTDSDSIVRRFACWIRAPYSTEADFLRRASLSGPGTSSS